MHDPITGKDSHLTLLHYTTQTLLSILRIHRDMLEDNTELQSEHAQREMFRNPETAGDMLKGSFDRKKAEERQNLRAELGKLIVDHLFLRRASDVDGLGEELDDMIFPETEDVEYELKMRDIMDKSNSSQLTAKRKLLAVSDRAMGLSQHSVASSRGMASPTSDTDLRALQAGLVEEQPTPPQVTKPKTLLDTKEEALVHKAEKEVSGRRVLITFYNETSPEDIMLHSHNIRIVVACVQTLNVLCCRDFHEEKLQMVCERRGKRHLMSAAREPE